MTRSVPRRKAIAATNVRRSEFPLVGAGGEPVDLVRTLSSHGVASLPPQWLDEATWTLEVTLPLPRGRPRTVRVSRGRAGHGLMEIVGRPPAPATTSQLLERVSHILRLDENLSFFYEKAGGDPDLAWVTAGAGRMMRSATVFEDVVKTICTTNCSWSATVRMVSALVEHLGAPAPNAPSNGPRGRAFPTPAAMAEADESFYREVARAGYRGRYLLALATAVAHGSLDLEALARADPKDLSDEEMAELLLALPGVGPYAAAHIMMMVGRYSRLILDSWTRPTYARITGRASVKDSSIERRFRRYAGFAGLAFWLYLTRDWVEDPGPGEQGIGREEGDEHG